MHIFLCNSRKDVLVHAPSFTFKRGGWPGFSWAYVYFARFNLNYFTESLRSCDPIRQVLISTKCMFAIVDIVSNRESALLGPILRELFHSFTRSYHASWKPTSTFPWALHWVDGVASSSFPALSSTTTVQQASLWQLFTGCGAGISTQQADPRLRQTRIILPDLALEIFPVTTLEALDDLQGVGLMLACWRWCASWCMIACSISGVMVPSKGTIWRGVGAWPWLWPWAWIWEWPWAWPWAWPWEWPWEWSCPWPWYWLGLFIFLSKQKKLSLLNAFLFCFVLFCFILFRCVLGLFFSFN